jgi:hypothetical protein
MTGVQDELQIGQQMVRFDREATVALYRDKFTTPGADQCSCISCENFAAQRTKVYPEDFLDLLDKLGINALTEWEAFDYHSDMPELPIHLYGGWFLFCGELIGGVDEGRPSKWTQICLTGSLPVFPIPGCQKG